MKSSGKRFRNIETLPSERAEVADMPLQVFVLDEAGVAVQDALVTITSESAVEHWRTQPARERCSTSPHRFESNSDAQGRTEVPATALKSPDDRCFLWATHTAHTATWIEITPEVLATRSPLRLKLGPARTLAAIVSSARAPTAGEVFLIQEHPPNEQLVVWDEYPDTFSDSATRARRSLVRVSKVEAGVPSQLPQFSFDTELSAWSELAASRVYIVVPSRTEIELELAPVFYLRGTLVCAGSSLAGQSRIDLFALEDSGSSLLSSLAIRGSAHFGPLAIPLPISGVLEVNLSSNCGSPRSVTLRDLYAGETREVVLQSDDSLESWFRVIGSDGNGIRGALVRLSWTADGTSLSTRGLSDDEGYAMVPGVDQGVQPQVVIQHPEFATLEIGHPAVHRTRETAAVFSMSEPRNISGHVYLGDSPATSFSIFVWTPENSDVLTFDFAGRGEGRFELDHLDQGPLKLMAVAHEGSASPTLQLEASADSASDIILRCPKSSSLRVQLTDSATGTPISNCNISAHPIAAGAAQTPVGTQGVSDLSGVARLEHIPASPLFIYARHPRYADRSVRLGDVAPGSARHPISLSLDRLQSVVVQLTPFPPAHHDAAWVRLDSPDRSEYVAASSSGTVQFEGVRPGLLSVVVIFPDSSNLYHETHLLPGDGDTVEVEIDLAEEPRLDVVFTDHRDYDQPIACDFFPLEPGRPNVNLRAVFGEDGVATLRGLPGDRGVVRVTLADQTDLAEVLVGPDDVAAGHIEVGASPVSFEARVVDWNGEGVTGQIVYAISEGRPYELYDWAYSEAEGITHVQRAGDAPCHVYATWNGVSSSVRRVDPKELEDEAVELRLIEPVTVRFTAPGAGPSTVETTADLYFPSIRQLVLPISTAAQVELSPGEYRVQLTTPSLWLDEELVRVPAAGGVVELAVRPIGTLVLSIGDEENLSVVGTQLVDALTEETAAQRVARGAIAVLRTATDHEFQGIPAGEYRWSAQLADGTSRAGTVEVAPGTRTVVELPPE